MTRPTALVLVACLALAALVSLWMSMEPAETVPAGEESAQSGRGADGPATIEPETPRTRTTPRRRAEAEVPEAEGLVARVIDPARAGRVSVRVLLAGDRTPVAGALVVAEDADLVRYEARTDDAGLARFDRPIDSGYARIEVTAPGMTRGRCFADKDAVVGGAECEVLVSPGASIDGRVIDASTLRAVAGARVTTDLGTRNGTGVRIETETAADGSFHLDGLAAAGPTSLAVVEPFHVTDFVSVDPRSGGIVDIRLAPAGAVRGVVSGPDGRPVPWARVTASGRVRKGAEARHVLSGTTHADAQGRYLLGGLEFDGVWSVVASKPGLADSVAQNDLVFDAGRREFNRDLEIRAPSQVAIRIVTPDGTPATNASIRLDGGNQWGGLYPCGEEGERVVEVYVPGQYVLHVDAPGFAPQAIRFDVPAGERVPIEVRLDQGAALTGVVVDDTGRPVESASVSVHDGNTRNGRPSAATSDRSGAFRVEGIATGSYNVTARAPGHEAARIDGVGVPGDAGTIVLPRQGRITLRVRLTSPSGGKPKCRVILMTRAGRWAGGEDMNSRDAGDVALACAPGSWTLAISADGHATVQRDVDVAPGAIVALGDVVLDAGLVLEGTVVDGLGGPIEGASVDARSKLAGLGSVETAADGRFRLEHVVAGEVVLAVSAEGFAATEVTFHAAPGSTAKTVTLRRGGVLEVTVRDQDGDVVSEKNLTIAPRDRPDDVRHTIHARGDGAATIHLAPGVWHVVAKRGDRTLAERDVEVREGETAAVELVVER